MTTTAITTFGDARRVILETIGALRDGSIDASRGLAIAANMKALNDNIQVEINVAKMVLATENRAKKFGALVPMGQRLIGDDKGAIE
jgi:hypothetical protein